MTAARKLTVDDLLALGEDVRAELIDGEIVPKAMSSQQHARRQGGTLGWLLRRYARNPGGRWPGGWWIDPEIHVVYDSQQVYCHDIAGWRRERLPPELETGWVRIRPDWVCELLSPGHEKRDLVDKMATMHRHAVPHYWVVDRGEKILFVYRYSPDGYVLLRSAGTGELLHAEPFAELELRTAVLFGDEDDEE